MALCLLISPFQATRPTNKHVKNARAFTGHGRESTRDFN
jgi:hypothetical protein